MLFLHFFALALSTFITLPTSLAQDASSLVGTWSSGSRNVITGAGFANPLNQTFIFPKTTGMSYSFSSDGFYEIARYRFTGNPAQPNCITGVMNFAHGTYTLQANGSITMIPFGDGFQQVQDTCAAVSPVIEFFNTTELYLSWNTVQDATDGMLLNLQSFDGTPVPRLYLVSTEPNMLPTQSLTNSSVELTRRKRDVEGSGSGVGLFARMAGVLGMS